MNWVMEHMEDPDLNTPAPASSAAAAPSADPAAVAQLVDMGFASDAACLALKETGGNLERAADWLFSRSPEDIAAALGKPGQTGGSAAAGAKDTSASLYRLKAVVSHVGKTATSGHYVAHVNQAAAGAQPEWVFFNDDKVVMAEEPPLDLGYLLLMERM